MGRSFILALVLFVNTNVVHSFTIGLPESLKGSVLQQQVESNFLSLYAGLENKLSFAYLPVDRMMLMIKQRKLDAVGYQFHDFVDPQFGMLPISEPITQFSLSVGCIEEKHCVIDERLGYVVISDALYSNLLCYSNQLNCLHVDSDELAIKALKEGIADGYIMQRSPHIKRPCYSERGFLTQALKNTEIDTYHFITTSHKAIAEPLALKLKQLKSSFSSDHKYCLD